MSRTRNQRRYPAGPRFGHQSRNRYYYGSGCCTGCTACSWYPKRLQHGAHREERRQKREVEEAAMPELEEFGCVRSEPLQ
jgi:hypothetical protein